MSVAFKSQTKVAYKNTSTIIWYGDEVAAFVGEYFVNAIDFSFKANRVDYSEVISKLATEFEALLLNDTFAVKAIDFLFEANAIDHTQDANKIDHSKGLS